MKNFVYLLILNVLFIQCQTPHKNQSRVIFKVHKFDLDKDQMEVSFEIFNNSENTWKGGDWSLHWNQFSGSLDQSSLPEDVKIIPTKNSQYWQIHFGSSFTVKPGESIKLSAIQKGIMRRLVMGPVGFFVLNSNGNYLYDLENQIDWKSAKGIDRLNIPSAEERFNIFEGIIKLPRKNLHWVIPTPKKLINKNSYRNFPENLKINFGEFSEKSEILLNHLQKGLTTQITKSNKNSQINILINNELGKEDYELKIKEDNIYINVSNYGGLFYAIVSLNQILFNAQEEKKGIPLLEINDSPRFVHRGFMLDLSRNFYPKEKILQIIDLMAYYKLNVLDLRLTDDEGWRIEIPGLPELTQVGSKRGFTRDENDRLFPMYGSGSGKKDTHGSGFISRKDFIEILKVAKERNIHVVPQISFPSHARSAIIPMKVRYESFMAKGKVEAANEFRLHDPNDKSKYTSAQLFSDNTICICSPSAFRFFDKVFYEIKAMYDEANHSMETFNIGADELPFGVWKKSPICDDYINNSSDINSYQDLYDSSVKRINKTIVSNGARMAGWEDVLLIHSEKSQSEIDINKNLLDIDFIPCVWNNTWGEGREDMIYKLSNIGFQSIMSNSSAFYFDMTDDMDMENPGLNWSGFVNYKDTWGTEPLNVFANKVKLKSLKLDDNDFRNTVSLKEDAVSNFLGIQSQLWTETATSDYHFDRMLMPNLIIFSERAWSSKEDWLDKKTAQEQEPLLNKSWNRFVNTVGQRHLPMISKLYEDILFDIPKAGGIIENGILKIRQQFPGLHIRYTTDGSEPDLNSSLYISPVKISSLSDVVIRVFDINGRGGNSINIKQK